MDNLKDRLIYDRVQDLAASAGTNYLRRNKVKPGEIEHIKKISVINEDNAYTRLRIGVWDGSTFFMFEEQIAPQSGRLYFTSDEIILREGMQLQAQLDGCTNGDKIRIFIYGERGGE